MRAGSLVRIFVVIVGLALPDAAQAHGQTPDLTAYCWYGVKRGQCTDLTVADGYTGDVYIYGTDGTFVWQQDDARFCIDTTRSFEVTDSDQASCAAPPYKRVGMRKFAVHPGTNTWTFRE